MSSAVASAFRGIAFQAMLRSPCQTATTPQNPRFRPPIATRGPPCGRNACGSTNPANPRSSPGRARGRPGPGSPRRSAAPGHRPLLILSPIGQGRTILPARSKPPSRLPDRTMSEERAGCDALSASVSDQARRTTLSALVDQEQEGRRGDRIARNELNRGLVAVLDVLEVQRILSTRPVHRCTAAVDRRTDADSMHAARSQGGAGRGSLRVRGQAAHRRRHRATRPHPLGRLPADVESQAAPRPLK